MDPFTRMAEEVAPAFGFDADGIAATARVLRRAAAQGFDPCGFERMAGHTAAAWIAYRNAHSRLLAGINEHGDPLTESERRALADLVDDQRRGARIMAAEFLILPLGRDHLAPVTDTGLDAELARFFGGDVTSRDVTP